MSRRTLAVALLALLCAQTAWPQDATTAQTPGSPSSGAISKADRERALGILNYIAEGIQNQYYDPKMHGLDWKATVDAARQRIAVAKSMNDALMQIAIAVSSLDDSHTRFIPPARPYHLEFGFTYQMVSDRCLVIHVRPGSDAESKGLKPGTEILKINGVVPKRSNWFNLEYVNHVLDPRPSMQLELRSMSGETQQLDIQAKLSTSQDVAYRPGAGVRYDVIRHSQNLRELMQLRVAEFNDVAIVKIPWFHYDFNDFNWIQGDVCSWLAGKIRKDRAVILDVRGNLGGSVDTLKRFVGMLLDHDVKLNDKVERKKTSPEIAKREPHLYFPGQVIVLVDSESASAAEIFARVMQLEKRGKVIGDRTSGMVMESTFFYTASSGVDYGTTVTVANLIMTDGKSLEHFGVIPDEIANPTQEAISYGNDPVLSHAAKELGVNITPEQAGKLFPYEWPKN